MLHLKKLIILLWCILLIAFGCVMTQKLTPMQKRHITTRVIEASYDDVFRATLTVLQDKDYNIKNTDMETGLIVADVERELSSGWKAVAALSHLISLGADETETEERWDYRVSCLITKMNESSAEVRINIHKVTHSKITDHKEDKAEVKQEPEAIYDQKIYQDFFNKIRVEVKRRQAVQ